jgi:hypothetical protein
MSKLHKKILLYLVIFLGIFYGYQYLTGKSITTLPGEIVDLLMHQEPRTESTNVHYYNDPAKRVPKD